MQLIDLTGKQFGRLIVVKRDGLLGRAPAWLCRCQCGNTKRTVATSLKRGRTRSCGCLNAEMTRRPDRYKPLTITCTVCGRKFTHRRGHVLKTCSKKCRLKHASDTVKWRYQTNIDAYIGRLFLNAQRRALKVNLPFKITVEDVRKLYVRQNGRCGITDLPLGISGKNCKRSPWLPSVDQINPGRGYTMKNIQLVCCIYNLCKHTWKHEDVVKFAKAILAKEKK